MYYHLRHKAFLLLETEEEKSIQGKLIDLFLVALILANVVAFVLQSEASIGEHYQLFFKQFELFSLVVFATEYLLRLWCVVDKHVVDTLTDTGSNNLTKNQTNTKTKTNAPPILSKKAWKIRLQWLFSPMALIDLIAILPAILQQFFALDLRMLRLLRLLRILKLSRYSQSLRLLMKVLARESSSLQAMLFILVVLIILSASGIYLVESKVQPEHFGSIPKAMWWAVVTLTTVGYGDVIPTTTLGKVFGACITILGIGIAALPAGILASGFASELEEQREALQEAFRNALTAQKIPLNQPKQIAKVRRQVGINKELADVIVRDMRVEQSLLAKTIRKKPTSHSTNQQTTIQTKPPTSPLAHQPTKLSICVSCPCCQHQHQVELALQHLTMPKETAKEPPDKPPNKPSN